MRISSQLEQLHQSFVSISNRFVESVNLMTSKRGGVSLTSVLRHIFGYENRRLRKQRSATITIKDDYLNTVNLERDYFNLKKLIIVSTLPGFYNIKQSISYY